MNMLRLQQKCTVHVVYVMYRMPQCHLMCDPTKMMQHSNAADTNDE